MNPARAHSPNGLHKVRVDAALPKSFMDDFGVAVGVEMDRLRQRVSAHYEDSLGNLQNENLALRGMLDQLHLDARPSKPSSAAVNDNPTSLSQHWTNQGTQDGFTELMPTTLATVVKSTSQLAAICSELESDANKGLGSSISPTHMLARKRALEIEADPPVVCLPRESGKSSIRATSMGERMAARFRDEEIRSHVTCAGEQDRIERLQKMFGRLCPDSTSLAPKKVHMIIKAVHGARAPPSVSSVKKTIEELQEALLQMPQLALFNEEEEYIPLNSREPVVSGRQALGVLGSNETIGTMCEDHVGIDCPLFIRLIQWHEINKVLDISLSEEALLIRDSLIKRGADLLIAYYARLDLPAELLPDKPQILQILDPLSGLVILLNALTIGISADIRWGGWAVCELVFTSFFTLEIVVKFWVLGCREQLRGSDRLWNYFDMTLVGLAVLDLVVQQLSGAHSDNWLMRNMRDFTLARLARLARLTRLFRLLRLLRLRIFKELLLMVRGVVAGLRTLFWAIVLLMFFVYAVSVGLMQTVGEDKIEIDDRYNTVLFNSLLWSMFNVFRCFMSDGVLPNGTPLVGHLEARYGAIFAIPYTFCSLFIVFGIYNLIAAIFVENVLESAKAKRELAETSERVRVALTIRMLLLKFSGHKNVSAVASKGVRRSSIKKVSTMFSRVVEVLSNVQDKFTPTSHGDQFAFANAHDFYELDGVITREMFEAAIRDPETLGMLDDLEIQMSDRTELFDVLDADNSGSIDICEMISGLMKMRSGGADRSDSVATILSLRSVQHFLRAFREEFGQLIEVLAQQRSQRDELQRVVASCQHMTDLSFHNSLVMGDDISVKSSPGHMSL